MFRQKNSHNFNGNQCAPNKLLKCTPPAKAGSAGPPKLRLASPLARRYSSMWIMKNSKVALLLSFLVPAVVACLAVQSTYWFNLRSTLGSVEFVYTILATSSGLFFFKNLKFTSKPIGLVVWVMYTASLIPIFFSSAFLRLVAMATAYENAL